MARRPRIAVPGMPMHITQRGHNRSVAFLDAHDFAQYRAFLLHASRRERCAVHAYALMSNHAHLLVTPSTSTGASRMMQLLGRLYVAHFNARHHRRGTLWEGRFRSAVVETSSYFLACCRYIDLNPVRAGMVQAPDAYEWTSYAHLGHGEPDALLTPHAEYLALGSTPSLRRSAYRACCGVVNGQRASVTIRRATQRGDVLGRAEFQRILARALERPAVLRLPCGAQVTNTTADPIA